MRADGSSQPSLPGPALQELFGFTTGTGATESILFVSLLAVGFGLLLSAAAITSRVTDKRIYPFKSCTDSCWYVRDIFLVNLRLRPRAEKPGSMLGLYPRSW